MAPLSETPPGPPTAPDLVVVGELNVDVLMAQVNGPPMVGKERTVDEMAVSLGSSSAILAANAASLGVSVGFVGRIGVDLFGTFVRERLSERHVDVRHISETPDAPTGLTVVFTDRGDSGMLTCAGAMKTLSIDDIPWEYVLAARHLHLSSYYLQTGLRSGCPALFEAARGAGLSTSLDTNWDPAEKWGTDVLDVLPYVTVFLPNRDEALQISGCDALEDALDFFEERVETVVVTCGAEGVVARHEGTSYSVPALPVRVVDAVGAGDSFGAGFLCRYLAGSGIEDCLRYGTLTAAFSTTALGGTGAFDDLESFERFSDLHLGAGSVRVSNNP